MNRNLAKIWLAVLLLSCSINALAQEIITGKVIDAKTKETLPGATVKLEGTTVATTANQEISAWKFRKNPES
jgi:hypothetical protein